MSVFNDSRYINTPLVTRLTDGTPMLSLRSRYNFNMSQATSYVWKESDTLDGVSYAFYDNTDLRWAILDANPKYRTEFDISDGDILLIPDYDEVVNLVDG